MLSKIDLKADALSYVREELLQGNTLAQYLLKLDLEDGKIFTFLPEELKTDLVNDLGESLHFLTGEHYSREFDNLITSIIVDYLSDDYKLVVFETIWGDPKKVGISRVSNYFIHSDSKYDYLTRRSLSSKELIFKTLTDAHSYPTIIVLTKHERVTEVIDPGQAVEDETLVEFAQNATGVIVGAFDGEGYVFWEKLP